jgi:hypothetical protein
MVGRIRMEEWEHLSRKKKEVGEQTYSDSIIPYQAIYH